MEETASSLRSQAPPQFLFLESRAAPETRWKCRQIVFQLPAEASTWLGQIRGPGFGQEEQDQDSRLWETDADHKVCCLAISASAPSIQP